MGVLTEIKAKWCLYRKHPQNKHFKDGIGIDICPQCHIVHHVYRTCSHNVEIGKCVFSDCWPAPTWEDFQKRYLELEERYSGYDDK